MTYSIVLKGFNFKLNNKDYRVVSNNTLSKGGWIYYPFISRNVKGGGSCEKPPLSAQLIDQSPYSIELTTLVIPHTYPSKHSDLTHVSASLFKTTPVFASFRRATTQNGS